VLAAFAIGCAALIAFAFTELRLAKHPLLDLRLFEKSTFSRAAFVGWVSVVALFGAEFLLPLYLQALRGRSALETGFVLLPMAVSSGIATPLAGRLYDRIGARALAVVGFSLLAVNTWQLSLLRADTTIGFLLFLLVIRGVALGMTVQTTFVTALSVVPIPQTARASALLNSTRQVVQAIAVAVLATILTASLSPALSARASQFQQAAPLTAANGQRIELCQPQTLPAVVPAPAKAAIETFCGEYISGLERAYRLTFYFSLLAIVLGATLPGWPAAWEGRRAARPQAEAAAGH
jgi:DHA2 family multidrug resistance protein